jgi:thioredoxin 1
MTTLIACRLRALMLGVLAGAAIGVVPGPALAMPPVFTKASYTEALAEAARSKKLVLIKATADWCPPCKQMDKTTWRDEALVKWIGEKAVAVYLDVDKEPKQAQELKVQAMPTMILLKDGKEFDRVVGFQSAPQMMQWLSAAERGESRADALRREAGERAGPDGNVDIRQRMNLADQLARSDKAQDLDLATDEYVWLWNNMLKHRESMYGVRLSFMATEMKDLAAKHPRARAEFVKLRDAAEARLKKDTGWDILTDWITLNLRVLDDKDAVLAWHDRIAPQPDSGPTLARYGRDLTELLVERGRWADAGRLFQDPMTHVGREIDLHDMTKQPPPMPAGMDPADAAKINEQLAANSRASIGRSVGQLSAALHAAGRHEEAQKVRAMVLDRADSLEVRRALLAVALEAKVISPGHLSLLEGASAKGLEADLIAKVRAAAK